ncbi:MAG TPA: hypothetical protein PKK06_09615 [Phycisphaerae bacterium]|nr:hypothetical protein [Phycisphaerae bacterium]HNU45557.1 hypothetical protein [Phycisphaerae bacterium]
MVLGFPVAYGVADAARRDVRVHWWGVAALTILGLELALLAVGLVVSLI